MPSYTTSDLLATIKTKALVPTNQSTFTDDQILIIADEELQMGIIPLIKEAREEYFVRSVEYDLVNGQTGYEIPSRAVGSTLSDILMQDGSSSRQFSIPFVEASMVTTRNDPYGFNTGTIAYLEANKVMLDPPPNGTYGGKLILKYIERRNNLVQLADAARIDSIDTVNNQIVLSSVPTTYNINETYDFVRSKPGFENLAIDQTPTGISGVTFTFSSLPDGLAVGDYLCLAGESPIVQIPVEFHMVLAQRVIVRILEALGDTTGVQVALRQLAELQNNAIKLITPRVQGEAKKVLNPYGPLNGGGRWRRWWNY